MKEGASGEPAAPKGTVTHANRGHRLEPGALCGPAADGYPPARRAALRIARWTYTVAR